ncbi:gliotoxin biosynthesis protein GliK [Westerdykella ornata]|uniref:gamma-glutamylcyclotransferase n=1 Tax=Westerdykella ornata TaxID=318751 RepID=A0A6A6JJ63_WESOR|nr:gliotoxin biosynthesis protein GliK [Westerdykella ornata]KAF2276641.1 gliotoxin biosynthesis protein GliK [Westerdykella ornata]
MEAKSGTLWYVAYGSNMSAAKFTGGRGIAPIDVARVRLPRWVLSMEIPGLPYSEPAFSSISRRGTLRAEAADVPDVIGLAYLITEAQYRHVIASEGGGTAYADIAVIGEGIRPEDQEKLQNGCMLRTLTSAGMTRSPVPTPSLRYMSLLVDGAAEARLPPEYQEYLQRLPVYRPPSTCWTKLGAWVFLAIWGPVMQLLERVTMGSIGDDGYASAFAIWLVRVTMRLIWITHDWLFAPIFGRGDGCTDRSQNVAEPESWLEKRRLLEGV